MRDAVLPVLAVLLVLGSGCLSEPPGSEPELLESEITPKSSSLTYETEIDCAIASGTAPCLQEAPAKLQNLTCHSSLNAYATCHYKIEWSVTGESLHESNLTAGGWEPERDLRYKPKSCQVPRAGSCKLSFVFEGSTDFASSGVSTVKVTLDTQAVLKNLGMSETEGGLEGVAILQITR